MAESLKIREAGAKGKGVFAEGAPAGDLVVDYEGKEQWIWDIPEDFWQYTFQVDYDRYILAGERALSAGTSTTPASRTA